MTNYEVLLEKVRELGMDYKWAKMFVKKLSDDEKAFPVSKKEAEFALKHGFYPGRVFLYGLNEENYKDYLPDFNYFMLHPMNNHFLKWLDKTTLKYVLNSNGCETTMPEYYLYVENDDSYTFLMDAPNDVPQDKDFILNLLRKKGVLAMKPNSGTSGGLGFIKLELRDDKLFENNKQIDFARFEEIKGKMRNYIVTEYTRQHHELSKIWPDSECTLRVIMVKDPKKDKYKPATWSCAASFARFGTLVNGGASNLSAGGVGVGFDFQTGKYNDFVVRYKRFCPDGEWRSQKHPDTGYEWDGKVLPNWEYVKQKIQDICNHISSLDYLGLDIIITEEGMKLCEINSHPAMDYAQIMCGPALAKPNIQEFFKNKGIYDIDCTLFYNTYMQSQE